MIKRKTIVQTNLRLIQRGLAKKNCYGLALTRKGKHELLRRIGLDERSIGKNRKRLGRYSNLNIGDLAKIFFPEIFSVIKKHFKSVKGKRILEIGFEESDLLKLLEKEGAITTGIELKKPSFTARVPNQVFGTAMNLPYKSNSIDCVIAIRVLEPTGIKEAGYPVWGEEKKEEKEKLIKEIKRVLQPNEIIITQSFFEPWISKQEWEKHGFTVTKATTELGDYMIAKK